MINSKVLFGWSFNFNGTTDFWNGRGADDYSLRYVDKSNKVSQVSFPEIFQLVEYVRRNNIEFGRFIKEIIPPCSMAMRDYTYQYFENDVVLKARRPLSHPWKSQYHAVDRGKGPENGEKT
ncbi:MAG: hypothetical protein AAGU27_10580 [Dehalobacterium sp.]